MATLLHIDSSLHGDEDSHSRKVTAAFRKAWEDQHPTGRVIYRDLAADPVPHITLVPYYASFTAAEERSAEQNEAFALRETLLQETEAADALLIGAPVYNYSIPSVLKAWIDHVVTLGRNVGAEKSPLAGKPTVVVTSRGGAYGPGTPEEGNDFAVPYLELVLRDKLELDLELIVPELTLAPVNEAMKDLIPLFEESSAKALAEAEEKGKALAARLSA